MFKKLLPVFYVSVIIILVFFLGIYSSKNALPVNGPSGLKKSYSKQIAIVLGDGNINDRSFKQLAHIGASNAKNQFGDLLFIQEISTIENSLSESLTVLEKLASQSGNDSLDLIIVVGNAFEKAIELISKEFPHKNFAIIDGNVSRANVMSINFKTAEAAYLAGILAAKTSRSSTYGFVGGYKNHAVVNDFFMGYRKGILSVNPRAKILTGYTNDWHSFKYAKSIAISMLKAGAEVIFAAAGESGQGALNAVVNTKFKETRNFYIGVDANQNHLATGHVLTSVQKSVHTAIYNLCKDIVNENFEPGVRVLGLKEEAVSISLDEHNRDLIQKEIIESLQKTQDKIISEEIKVYE